MDDVVLPPELEQFAAEAVASGQYRDRTAVIATGLDLLRKREQARAELLASVVAAEEEADRVGCLSLDAVEHEMRAAIHSVARRRA